MRQSYRKAKNQMRAASDPVAFVSEPGRALDRVRAVAVVERLVEVRAARASTASASWPVCRARSLQRQAEQGATPVLELRQRCGEEIAGGDQDRLRGGGRLGEAAGAGGARVVTEPEPDGYAACRAAGAPEAPRHPVDDRDEHPVELLGRAAAAAEGRLGADRPAAAPVADPSRVAVPRDRVELAPGGAPHDRDRLRLLELRELGDGPDTLQAWSFLGRRADAPEALDRQRQQ